jgi:hypothetical protein
MYLPTEIIERSSLHRATLEVSGREGEASRCSLREAVSKKRKPEPKEIMRDSPKKAKKSNYQKRESPIKDSLLFCLMKIMEMDVSAGSDTSPDKLEKEFRKKMCADMQAFDDLRLVTNQRFTKICIEECKSDLLMNESFDLLHLALFCAVYQKRVLFRFDVGKNVVLEFIPLRTPVEDSQFIIEYSHERKEYVLSEAPILSLISAPVQKFEMHQYNKAMRGIGTYKVSELRAIATNFFKKVDGEEIVSQKMGTGPSTHEIGHMAKSELYSCVQELLKKMIATVSHRTHESNNNKIRA